MEETTTAPVSQLNKFFAVTLSGSVYEASAEGSIGRPEIVRVHPPVTPPSICVIDERIGISRDFGLVMHHDAPRRRNPVELVKMAYWSYHTSPIVALFLDQEQAYTCSASPELLRWDDRWNTQTTEAINRIGTDHPVFIASPPELSRHQELLDYKERRLAEAT